MILTLNKSGSMSQYTVVNGNGFSITVPDKILKKNKKTLYFYINYKEREIFENFYCTKICFMSKN